MILVGLGANLPSRYGAPEDTIRAAVKVMEGRGLRVGAASRIWVSAPVPVSEQPWYRNAVVSVRTGLGAAEMMAVLQQIEADFGRVRAERNAPRLLDLDLLAYDGLVSSDESCVLPHPRMHQRAFVLRPLAEICPDWRHPVLKLRVGELIDMMPAGQDIEVTQELAA